MGLKSLKSVALWRGAPLSVPVTITTGELRYAVLLQQGKGGPIIAAARL